MKDNTNSLKKEVKTSNNRENKNTQTSPIITEKLIAKSKIEKGIIDSIEKLSRERPLPIKLDKLNSSQKNASHKVRTALLTAEFDCAEHRRKVNSYLANIPKKFQDKVEKLVKQYDNVLSNRLHTMRRNQAIQAMIMDGVWSSELADAYQILEEDVKYYHTKHIRIKVFLNHTTHSEFREFLKEKALKAYLIEKKKYDDYVNGITGKTSKGKGLLRNLIAVNNFKRGADIPRLWIEEKLFGQDSTGRTELQRCYEERESYYTRKDNTGEGIVRQWYHFKTPITQHEYREQVQILDNKLRKLQKERQQFFNKFFIDGESNKNMTYIKAVGKKELETYIRKKEQYDNDNTLRVKPTKGLISIHVTSVGQGEALIKIYCKWYNNKFSEQIKETQKEKERERINQKNENLRAENRVMKLERDKQIIDLRNSSTNNGTEIARILGLKERTVRDIINRYDKVIEECNKGKNFEEISNQTGTKIRTVKYYIELYTGELQDETILNEEQQAELLRIKIEEEEARKRIIEREVKQLHRKEIKKLKEEQIKKVIRLHNIGRNSREISKEVPLPISKINHILTKQNLTPHFDWKTASPEEIEEWREQERIKISKNLVIIDL